MTHRDLRAKLEARGYEKIMEDRWHVLMRKVTRRTYYLCLLNKKLCAMYFTKGEGL